MPSKQRVSTPEAEECTNAPGTNGTAAALSL
eukprot:CAMPEP_0119320118 /NCGR_PEP_ID=MMETSP1333-20130426/51512_1 /TAXON_ID=418940 /ORGANISM="Scyphosphaera apsteinii, Strain RCC1455" /LENGTH=30 /DNA_ID= /DNA_START= /DNA_END= /DNA_ORIENTATION=